MRKALLVLSVLAIALAAGSGVGFAALTLGGPTGGAVLPDAMVVPPGQLDVAADWTRISSESLGDADLQAADKKLAAAQSIYEDVSEDFTIIPVRVAYGIGSGAELWGAWTRISNSDDMNAWGVGAKYQFMREPKDSVNLAVGAGYVRLNDGDAFSAWNAYVAATKELTPLGKEGWAWGGKGTRVLGTLGVMYQKLEDFDGDLLSPYVGIQFVGEQGTSLGLEYRFKDSDVDNKGVFSAVIRHPLTKDLSVQVGVTNGAVLGMGGEDFDLFAGLSYRFGLAKAEE